MNRGFYWIIEKEGPAEPSVGRWTGEYWMCIGSDFVITDAEMREDYVIGEQLTVPRHRQVPVPS